MDTSLLERLEHSLSKLYPRKYLKLACRDMESVGAASTCKCCIYFHALIIADGAMCTTCNTVPLIPSKQEACTADTDYKRLRMHRHLPSAYGDIECWALSLAIKEFVIICCVGQDETVPYSW